jgi:hypothetical protein
VLGSRAANGHHIGWPGLDGIFGPRSCHLCPRSTQAGLHSDVATSDVKPAQFHFFHSSHVQRVRRHGLGPSAQPNLA